MKCLQKKAIISGESGFTLIEIIIVLGILATLIGTLIGSLGSNSQKAQMKQTDTIASQVYMKLLTYQTEVKHMPKKDEGLATLYNAPNGSYGSPADYKDAWGNEFGYDPVGPKLISAGPDGQMGTADDLSYLRGVRVEASPADGAANAGDANAPK